MHDPVTTPAAAVTYGTGSGQHVLDRLWHRATVRRAGGLLAALLLPWAPDAWGGPFEIGDADIVSRFRIEGHMGLERSHEERVWERPAINAGLRLADTLELAAGAGYGSVRSRHGGTSHGASDMFVALKWRMAAEDEDGWRPALAMEPELAVPTGDRGAGISDGATALVLPLRAIRHLGPSRVTAELAYARVSGRSQDTLSYGLLYEYAISHALTVGAEWLNDTPLQHDGDRSTRANLGLRWNPWQHVEVYGLLGRDRDREAGAMTTVARFGVEYVFD